jgi:hypothetical protein
VQARSAVSGPFSAVSIALRIVFNGWFEKAAVGFIPVFDLKPLSQTAAPDPERFREPVHKTRFVSMERKIGKFVSGRYGHPNGNFVLVTTAISDVLSSEF